MADSVINLFIGNIIHCEKPFKIQTYNKGFVAVKGSKIVAIDHIPALENYKLKLRGQNVKETLLRDTQILIPGLIDTHIHPCQYPNIGLGLNKSLLQWLKEHTFPLEKKFEESEFSKKVYDAVVKKTLWHGTTTACYFATIYTDSTLMLADVAIKFGQRAFVGKVNLTKNGPEDYLESSEETIVETKRFINEMLAKKSNLVKPIISPRFGLSVTIDEMKKLALMAKEYDLAIQTHMCECEDEIEAVRKCCNKAYPEVYDEAGLLTDKTILAHCVILTKPEMELLANRKSSVSHCPNSNINLRSGLCDVKALTREGVNVGLGTDVSGGSSVSIIDAMRCAITCSTALSFGKPNYEPVDCYDAFYLATLGGAKALSLDGVIGNFEVGKDFDALIVDMNVEDGNADYLTECNALELLQKFVYVGDDRNVISVFVAGKKIK